MTVSITELYKQTGVDSNQGVLMPQTQRNDGEYPGFFRTNYTLGVLLSIYGDVEAKGALESIQEDEKNNGWAKVMNVYKTISRERDDDIDSLEYGIMLCREKGYIVIELWDGVRYFKPTEKCMDLDLYRR